LKQYFVRLATELIKTPNMLYLKTQIRAAREFWKKALGDKSAKMVEMEY